MIAHRRLRLLGLAFAAAAVCAVAPGTASADDHRRDRDRYEHRDGRHDRHDRDRYERHDRDRHDRWDRRGNAHKGHGPAKHARKHDPHRDRHYASRYDHRYDRWDHRYDRRHDRWDRRYDGWDRRFHRHDRRRVGLPFWCANHRVGFHDRGRFDRHLIHDHYLPYWALPRLVAHVGFGWTFGH
jgi:hypothetical protein